MNADIMIVKNLFFLITLFLFLGCLCTPDDGGACSVLDGRFSCEKASVDGLGVRFVDAPQGKYYMSDVWLERDDLESDSQGEHVNCGFTKGNSPSKDAVIMFDCTPSSSGKYILHFDVNHNEPPSYQPVSGETCLKSAAQWSCSTRGHLTFTASGAISQTTTTALNSLGGLAAIP
ncbi:MAG TPA: hypothetical protein ENN13_02460, partial [Candidatus Altiarchaeales archaeon]|nr:hypothetical protein [Candidatus Altiarchaeales archaeon]